MKYIYIIAIFLSFTTTAFCQPTKNDVAHPNRNATIAKDHIKNLREGVLLVRLKTRENKINALKRAGAFETAKKVAQEQAQENMIIIKAFRDTFNFCPVYFFYSSDSRFIANQQLDSVVFLSDDLKPDSSLSINGNFYLVAEFDQVKEIKGTENKDETYYYKGDNGYQQGEKGAGYTNMGFSALVVKDGHFNQMARPFPYYVKTNENIFFLRKPKASTVNQLNLNFYSFYSHGNATK